MVAQASGPDKGVFLLRVNVKSQELLNDKNEINEKLNEVLFHKLQSYILDP